MSVDISALRTAIPYIRAYRGKIFVIKLSGELCIPGQALDHLIEQCAFLYQLGVQLVIVHGGGPQATNLCERLGIKSEFVDGRRITSAEMLEVAKMSFAGLANTDLLAACRKQQLPAVGISGIDGNLITCRKRSAVNLQTQSGQSKTVDFGYVGEIEQVRGQFVKDLLSSGYLPVVASLAADGSGQIYNINADTISARIAIALEATKYFVVSRVDGVLRDVNNKSTLISELDVDEVNTLIENGQVYGGMLPKLSTCIEVVRAGIPRAHIVNGLEKDTVLRELFTNEGCGTLVVEHKR